MVQQVQLPVLLSLLPKVGKMILAEQDRAPMQQALTAALMQDALKKEREKIPEVQKTEGSFNVHADDEHDQGRGGRRQHQGPRDQTKPEEESSSGGDPWSGQIVDLKV